MPSTSIVWRVLQRTVYVFMDLVYTILEPVIAHQEVVYGIREPDPQARRERALRISVNQENS